MKSSRRFRNDLAGDFAILASNSKREYIYVWDGKNWNDDPSTAKWYKTYPAMKKAFKAAGYPAGSVSVAAGTYEECVRLWDGTSPLVEPTPRTKEGFGTTFYRAPGTGQIQNPGAFKGGKHLPRGTIIEIAQDISMDPGTSRFNSWKASRSGPAHTFQIGSYTQSGGNKSYYNFKYLNYGQFSGQSDGINAARLHQLLEGNQLSISGNESIKFRRNPHITARKRLPYRSSTFRGGMTDYDTFSREANESEIAELKAKGYTITKHRSPLIQAARADKQHFVFGTIANPEGDLLPGDLLIGDAQRYYGHHVPWKLDERDLKIINRLRRAHPKLLSGTPSDTSHLNVLIDKKLWENARKPRTNPSAEYDNLMRRVDEAKQKGYNASAYVNLERRTWISENEPRAQASRFLHNMIKALNIHSWQNTAEEWQRMYDAKYTLALRGRRSRSTLSTKNKMRINPGLPTTGKYSRKKYKCMTCGHISDHGTNHYGEIYPRCRACGWKHPMEIGQTHQ